MSLFVRYQHDELRDNYSEKTGKINNEPDYTIFEKGCLIHVIYKYSDSDLILLYIFYCIRLYIIQHYT